MSHHQRKTQPRQRPLLPALPSAPPAAFHGIRSYISTRKPPLHPLRPASVSARKSRPSALLIPRERYVSLPSLPLLRLARKPGAVAGGFFIRPPSPPPWPPFSSRKTLFLSLASVRAPLLTSPSLPPVAVSRCQPLRIDYIALAYPSPVESLERSSTRPRPLRQQPHPAGSRSSSSSSISSSALRSPSPPSLSTRTAKPSLVPSVPLPLLHHLTSFASLPSSFDSALRRFGAYTLITPPSWRELFA